jgi:hypothetical protein
MRGEGESESLLSPIVRQKQSAERLKLLGKGVIWNRIAILVVLALLAAFSLYSESQISDLQVQLETAHDRIHELETVNASTAPLQTLMFLMNCTTCSITYRKRSST